MTLVLALRCQDAVVLASDGQATIDAAGQPTRAAQRKLFAAGGWLAWGCAGTVGLQQSVAGALDESLALVKAPSAAAVRRELVRTVIPIQQQALRDHVPVDGALAPEIACVFAWHGSDGPQILSIPRTGADHQFHARHASIGSGDIFAELALRQAALHGAGAMTIEQAKMLAFRAVADAIDVAAVYLGPPIQLTVVDARGAHAVGSDEIDGPLADAVELWRLRELELLGELGAVG